MVGKGLAVSNGDELVNAVVLMEHELSLESQEQVRVGQRIWGAIRHIHVVITHPQTRKTLGVECKFQAVLGTAEEKIPAVINDTLE